VKVPPALEYLARQALQHLLDQRPMTIAHAANWQREPGFPLPIKRGTPDADGITHQSYRPLAILEYVHDSLAAPRHVKETDA